ncbi:hypothetical protein ABIA35_001701 [Catenulispora sp. MAP12-49]|uniref:hypothetical protein n=1 Tax=unclassified Catenulispora TaxID=414885 RepID=UPI003514B0C0
MAEYRETRTALTWPLVVAGGVVPAALMLAGLVLGVAVGPAWFVVVVVVPFCPPFIVYISLLWRNRRTGIAVDDAGLRIGALDGGADSYQAPWVAVRSARIETSAGVVDAMLKARRIFSANRYWGVPRGHSHYTIAAGVLVPPFARTVLIVELAELTGVEARPPKPRRYFGNYLNVASFSRRYQPKESTVWLVPTRRPEDLASALAQHGFG